MRADFSIRSFDFDVKSVHPAVTANAAGRARGEAEARKTPSSAIWFGRTVTLITGAQMRAALRCHAARGSLMISSSTRLPAATDVEDQRGNAVKMRWDGCPQSTLAFESDVQHRGW
jgi:hypothetical protein